MPLGKLMPSEDLDQAACFALKMAPAEVLGCSTDNGANGRSANGPGK